MTTPDELKKHLAGIQHQAARADLAGRNIVASARERRDQVTARLEEIKGQALTDPQAAEDYKALLEERGQLDTVIAGG